MGLLLKEVDDLGAADGKGWGSYQGLFILTHGARWAVSKGAGNQGHSKATTVVSESSGRLRGPQWLHKGRFSATLK